MPISGPSSFLPTIDLFLAHWSALNLVETAGAPPVPVPVVLEGNRTVATLTTQRGGLAALRTDVEVKLNGVEFTRADYSIKRHSILGRVAQFIDNVRAFWSTTAFVATLPDQPTEETPPMKMNQVLDDLADTWAKINAATPPAGVLLPLKLSTEPTGVVPAPPPYLVAAFTADIAALKTAELALAPAQLALDSSRSARNALQELIRPTLVDYREAAVAKLPPHHALLGSLPRYSPLPGSTPDAVNATGHWDVATGMAVIDFTPSASASVVTYQLRYVPGPDYHTDDESIDQTISAGSPLHFSTLAGLPVSGVTASYRIYAITADGNEHGSATIVITRPV